MLRLAPALEELWMGLSSPHTLSRAFFLAFAAGRPNIASARIGLSNQTIAPFVGALKKLHLHYKRWLRGLEEQKALISTFGDIVASHRARGTIWVLTLLEL
jgi:hypothetical protein